MEIIAKMFGSAAALFTPMINAPAVVNTFGWVGYTIEWAIFAGIAIGVWKIQ